MEGCGELGAFSKAEPKGLQKLGVQCYSIPLDPTALSHYARALGISDPGWALQSLGRAVASSLFCKESSGAVLFSRSRQRPSLILLTDSDEACESRFKTEGSVLNRDCSQLQYVDYGRAEQICRILASRLVERFTKVELSRFHFAAIPRGGHIVLGLLAYILNLRPAQLAPPHPPDIPLVVVDDCSLTGARFRQFMKGCAHQRVVFVSLYSHPALRAAIESEELRVLACLSAKDLFDYAPDRLGHGYSAWQERWRSRLKGDGYWVGQVSVCFAWNEPDRLLWNRTTQQSDYSTS